MTLSELGKIVFKQPASDRAVKAALDSGYIPNLLKYEVGGDYYQILNEWKLTFVGAYANKFFPKRRCVIDSLVRGLGRFPTCDDFTRLGIEQIFDILKNQAKRGMCNNTLHQYGKDFKAVLNELQYDIELPFKGYKKSLTVKREDSQFIYLTESEIERLDNYEPENWLEAYTKKLFMISCYTGCRDVDAKRITLSHISNGMLSFVTQKTKTTVTMKAKPALIKYLKQDIPEYKGVTDYSLKEMCKKVRINSVVTVFQRGKEMTKPKWYFVSPHTARRSFATNLHLRGADINTIRFLMGHSDIAMTMNYICDVRELDKNALKFFD